MKLSAAQMTALETAGAFEEPLDEDDQILSETLQDGHLVTTDPQRLSRIMYDLSNAADDYAEQRDVKIDADARRMYRGDCQVFLRLARKLARGGLKCSA